MTNCKDRKIREAYRLLFKEQESIVTFVELIKNRINAQKHAGMQLFSDRISTTKPAIGGCTNKFGDEMWAWDYFPAYMYMYYFDLVQEKGNNACFAIIQIMDDGSFCLKNPNGIAPDPDEFKDTKDSQSYFLFAFSKWDNKEKKIWFDYKGEERIKEVSDRIIRIANEINQKTDKIYFLNDDSNSSFVVRKIDYNIIEDESKANTVLDNFEKIIRDKCNYCSFLKKNSEL